MNIDRLNTSRTIDAIHVCHTPFIDMRKTRETHESLHFLYAVRMLVVEAFFCRIFDEEGEEDNYLDCCARL